MPNVRMRLILALAATVIWGGAAQAVTIPSSAAGSIPGTPGTGLSGSYYKVNQSFSNFATLDTYIAANFSAPTATFNALNICYPSCFTTMNDNGNTLSSWLGSNATNIVGGSAALGDGITRLNGFIAIGSAGTHTFNVLVDDYVNVVIGGTTAFTQFGGGAVNDQVTFQSAGLYSFSLEFIENSGGTDLTVQMDGATLPTSILYGASDGSSVPEPTSLALMFGAIGGLIGLRRSRR